MIENLKSGISTSTTVEYQQQQDRFDELSRGIHELGKVVENPFDRDQRKVDEFNRLLDQTRIVPPHQE